MKKKEICQPKPVFTKAFPAVSGNTVNGLGKHGSIINDQCGSNFRLSAVTTEMPLLADQAVDIGVEDFCTGCQVCTNACLPDAISNDKKWCVGQKNGTSILTNASPILVKH